MLHHVLSFICLLNTHSPLVGNPTRILPSESLSSLTFLQSVLVHAQLYIVDPRFSKSCSNHDFCFSLSQVENDNVYEPTPKFETPTKCDI